MTPEQAAAIRALYSGANCLLPLSDTVSVFRPLGQVQSEGRGTAAIAEADLTGRSSMS